MSFEPFIGASRTFLGLTVQFYYSWDTGTRQGICILGDNAPESLRMEAPFLIPDGITLSDSSMPLLEFMGQTAYRKLVEGLAIVLRDPHVPDCRASAPILKL